MKKYMPIIKDGIILITVATLFVTAFNQAFKGLKKGKDADLLVTMILQEKMPGAEDIFSEKGFEKEKSHFANISEYQKSRANKTDEFGRTPLMRVAYANFSEEKKNAELDPKRLPFIDLLAKNGADLNAQDNDGWTALMWASWSGLNGVAGKLVEAGANTNLVDVSGNSALMIAAMRGNGEIVKLLLSKGADKNLATKDGKKALDLTNEHLKKYPSRAQNYQNIIQLLNG